MLNMFYYCSFIFYLNFYQFLVIQFFYFIKILIIKYNIDININNKKNYIKY